MTIKIDDSSSSSSLKARLQQQQQPLQPSSTVASSSLSSTPSSSPQPPSSGNRRAIHRPAPVRRFGKSGTSTTSTNTASHELKESGSLLWTLLLVGLFFCLIDISYMVVYLERKHEIVAVSTNPSSSSDTTTTTTAGISQGIVSGRSGLQQSNPQQQQRNMIQQPMIPEEEEEPPAGPPKTRAQLEEERLPILQVLRAAGIGDDLDDETLRLLPTWAEFTGLYGAEPHVYGLHMCESFQNRSDPADHFVSTAGNFNTGTNLMAELLISNCHMQKRMDKYGEENRGIRWQVPW
jgi:hypothetical protein